MGNNERGEENESLRNGKVSKGKKIMRGNVARCEERETTVHKG